MDVRIFGLLLVLIAGLVSILPAQAGGDTSSSKPGAVASVSGLVGSKANVVPAKQKRQNSDIRVTMYMTSWCPYCNKAREYLKGLGVKLTEYDIEKNAAKREEMKKLNKGSTGVPVINVEGIIIPGYAPDAIKEAVEKRKNSEEKG